MPKMKKLARMPRMKSPARQAAGQNAAVRSKAKAAEKAEASRVRNMRK